jgi:hypothetical protein
MSDENQNTDGSNLNSLLVFLEDTPGKLVTLISDLSDAELRWKHSREEFSALENICHLRDLELQGYAPRIRRMLDETNPVLPDFDGARVAAESSYNNEAPAEALEAFGKARQENMEKLRGLTAKQPGREGTLEGVGRITLKQLAEKMLEHDEGHLEDLRVLRLQLRRSPEIEKVLS